MAPVTSIIDDAARRYGIDPVVMRTIAQIESNMDPTAQNPRSSAGGLFQFIDSTWEQYGGGDKMDPYRNADAAARYLRDVQQTLTQMLGREPTPSEMYLGHQQGPSGAARLLSNPDAPAEQIVGRDAVRLNAGTPGMNARQFAGLWNTKYNSAARAIDDTFDGGAPQPMAYSARPPMPAPPSQNAAAASGEAPGNVLPRLNWPNGGRGVPGGLPAGYGNTPMGQPPELTGPQAPPMGRPSAPQTAPPVPMPRVARRGGDVGGLQTPMDSGTTMPTPTAPVPMSANAGLNARMPEMPAPLSGPPDIPQASASVPASRPAPPIPRPRPEQPIDLMGGDVGTQYLARQSASSPPQGPPATAPTPAPRIEREGPLHMGGFRFPGLLGAIQNIDQEVANASGPRSSNFDNWLISKMNAPGSNEKQRAYARRTGDTRGLEPGDRRYNARTNSWEVK